MCALSNNPSFTENLIERCENPVADATRQGASVHLLDWLGCILAGQDTRTGHSLGQFSSRFTPAAGVAFNAAGKSLCALEAAFINGGLGNILEMDDLHRLSLLHAGDTVLPAALAVAQEVSANMVQLLDAIVKGYEVAIQIGLVAASGGYSSWYNSSTCGVFGTGMAASVLLQLNRDETRDALGQCGMLASGLWQCRLEPGSSKQLATANATRAGVMAALLAGNDFPGPRQILEGDLGFFKTLYPSSTVARVDTKSVHSWRINEVSFKPWPACRHTHPAIEAAMSLAATIDVNEIESIEIGSYRSGLDFCDNPTPASDHEARFSLQYCVATTLLRGSPEVIHFNDQARADLEVRTLIERTRLTEDVDLQRAFPGLFGGRVSVMLTDKQLHTKTVTSARGDPENPMRLDEIRDKFSGLATAAGVERNTSDALLSLLSEFDNPVTLAAVTTELHAIENQSEKNRYATE